VHCLWRSQLHRISLSSLGESSELRSARLSWYKVAIHCVLGIGHRREILVRSIPRPDSVCKLPIEALDASCLENILDCQAIAFVVVVQCCI